MPPKKKIVRRRPPPPRTIADALQLLKQKGDAAIHSATDLALLTRDQQVSVLSLYAAWKAKP